MSSEKSATRNIPSLPHWMKNSLEHFNTTTNLDDFGASPPENESVFLHEPFHHHITESNPIPPIKPSTLIIKAKPRPLRKPHHQEMCKGGSGATTPPGTNGLPSGLHVIEAGTDSNHTTPSVTPQHSPSLVRKILAADIGAGGAHCIANSGLSMDKHLKCVGAVMKQKVTNFDLNAVSPTSW